MNLKAGANEVLGLATGLLAATEPAGTATTTAGLPAAVSPALVLVLCILGGIGTVLALPRRGGDLRPKLGGVLLALAGVLLAVVLIRWTAGAVGRSGVLRASYVYFWIFSAVALAASVRVITHPKPVYSALYFVLTVFASAGLFVLMWADFMAAALVLIYAGAILVTYVFVIMLASEAAGHGTSTGALSGLPDHDANAREPFLASLMGFGLMGVILFVTFDKAQPMPKNSLGGPPGLPGFGGTQQLGAFLFDNHFVNIQLAGLLLTLAMVGAILIARKRIVHAGGSEAEARMAMSPLDVPEEVVLGPSTPQTDDPNSIEVAGTTNPRQKAYPEN